VAAPLPIIQAPMAATDVQRPFHHPGWVYEEKVDGWRVLTYKNADGVRLIGEIAVFDRQLISRFEWLGGRPTDDTATPPLLMAFDCLYARGKDLRKRALRVGRNVLEEIVDGQHLVLPARPLAPDYFEAWAQVLARGYEGLVGKDEASRPTVKVGRSPGSRSSIAGRPRQTHRTVGQPRDEGQVRRLHETFLKSRPEVEAALAKCFADPKTVLACVELLARLDGELPLRDGKVADRATGAATGITGENSGVANLTPFQPGQSGNLAGRPQGDGLMRKRLMKAFLANEKQAMAAMARRWPAPATSRTCGSSSPSSRAS
jgi:hypothetical protein